MITVSKLNSGSPSQKNKWNDFINCVKMYLPILETCRLFDVFRSLVPVICTDRDCRLFGVFDVFYSLFPVLCTEWFEILIVLFFLKCKSYWFEFINTQWTQLWIQVSLERPPIPGWDWWTIKILQVDRDGGSVSNKKAPLLKRCDSLKEGDNKFKMLDTAIQQSILVK